MLKDLSLLMTEQRNPHSLHIDEMDTIDMLKVINQEDQKVALAIHNVIPEIARAVDAIYERLSSGGRLIYIGAGTSGRLGILDASECPPTYGVSSDLVQGIIAGGTKAIQLAVEGAEDSLELAIQDLKKISLSSQDVVCGLAASGRTPYVIGGLEYANQIGAMTISICCVENGAISQHAKYPIEILVGPEVITGSTRMKAGTAQKMVLNMISTSVMIKIGKVYQNLMIDVQPTNEKLKARSIRIVMQAVGVGEKEATQLLTDSHFQVKVAILKGLTGDSEEKCLAVLEENKGIISQTVKKSRSKNML